MKQLFLMILIGLSCTTIMACNSQSYQHLSRIIMGRVLTEAEVDRFCKIESRDGKNIAVEQYFIWASEQEEFINYIYALLRAEYLEGSRESDIIQGLIDFDQVKLQEEHRDYGIREFKRMEDLYFATERYNNDEIRLKDIQRALLDNYIYDQINMGVDNFVISVFQHLLGRPPTEYEKSQAKQMCNNTNGQLFFQKGESRADFLAIMQANDNYLEYQLRYWYERILFRPAELTEINELLKGFSNSNVSLEEIISEVLRLNDQ